MDKNHQASYKNLRPNPVIKASFTDSSRRKPCLWNKCLCIVSMFSNDKGMSLNLGILPVIFCDTCDGQYSTELFTIQWCNSNTPHQYSETWQHGDGHTPVPCVPPAPTSIQALWGARGPKPKLARTHLQTDVRPTALSL